MIEDLLQCDSKKKITKGKAIIGTVEALAPADEEQGRKTLQSHWQCWNKELSQELRDQLFNKDEEKKTDARKRFTQLIDNLLHTSYGPDLLVEHACNDVSVQSVSDPTNVMSGSLDRKNHS